jgi:UDP-N-acetylglucosamine acyltransferase
MIDGSAIVHPDARIEPDVRIGPYCIVGPGVFIGRGSVLDSHVVIVQNARIGQLNRIHSHVVIGGDPQDLKYDGAPSYVEVGDRNTLREYVTINRGSREGNITRLGSDCLLMAGVHLAHDCRVGDRVVMANLATLAGHVQVEERTTIGGLAAFHQFVRVGKLAMIGGTAGVMQDVPPYCMIQGSPPATLRGLNRIGIMRNGASEESFKAVKQAYRLMFRRGMTKENALAEIAESVPKTPEVVAFVEFLAAPSRRGVSKGEPVEDVGLSVMEGGEAAQMKALMERITALEARIRDLDGGLRGQAL